MRHSSNAKRIIVICASPIHMAFLLKPEAIFLHKATLNFRLKSTAPRPPCFLFLYIRFVILYFILCYFIPHCLFLILCAIYHCFPPSLFPLFPTQRCFIYIYVIHCYLSSQKVSNVNTWNAFLGSAFT